jgi:dolichyl-phosphate-mannose-protein mannosyltransferase
MSTTTTDLRALEPRRESLPAAFRRWLNRPVVAIVVVGLFAGVLRFVHLSYPDQRIFDEVYYSKSGCIFLGYSNERCDVASSDEKYWRRTQGDVGDWVHPPLGKWMIAAGELALGTGSFGWRVSSAVTGTLTVVALAMIVQVLFGSPLWTFVGGVLLATESLDFVQSRTSMLDIFVTFWIVLAFLFLILDKRWIDARAPAPRPPDAPPGGADAPATEPPPTPRVPSPLARPWRIATGVALGAAVAAKWSGVTAILGCVALAAIWEVQRRREAGMRTRTAAWKALQWEAFPIVVCLLLLPGVVYVVSYVGWFVQFGFDPVKWAHLQGAMANYSEHLQWIDPNTGKPIHPYLSHAWQWLLLWRPVLYYAKYGQDVRRVIYANGNPAVFWASVIAIPWAVYAWRRRRDSRAGFILLAIASLYLPWFFVSRPQFLFYATPITPFLVLADVYLLKALSETHVAGSRSRPYLPVAAGFVVVSVALFFWFWPALTGGPLSGSAWQLRAWFPSWV